MENNKPIKKEQKLYTKYFSHFALRLVERYNIFITFEDYLFLCGLFLKNSHVRH